MNLIPARLEMATRAPSSFSVTQFQTVQAAEMAAQAVFDSTPEVVWVQVITANNVKTFYRGRA